MKKKWIDYEGKPMKLPKSMQELHDMMQDAIRRGQRHHEDHVLYLQGKPNRTFGRSYATTDRAADTVAPRPTAAELRVDLSMSIQRLAESNAKLGECLAQAIMDLRRT